MTQLYRSCLVLIGLLALIASSLAGTLPASAVTPQVPRDRAIVIGGIDPCEGLPPRGGPRYAAGTVTVLKGSIVRKPTGGGNFASVFPKHVVSKVSVATNAMYRFVLAPGHYVLTAHLPHSNVGPFVQVTLKRGETKHVDIPNMCI